MRGQHDQTPGADWILLQGDAQRAERVQEGGELFQHGRVVEEPVERQWSPL